MYLKKIELNGFKSFAHKTILDFSYNRKNTKRQSITAIVGPNGSGKSNIADALRWVMGEQSLKILRGKKSQDVIFSGSNQKASKGVAEVTLYLDNQDKTIPLNFSEIIITRKLFRSGEAEYLINKSRVRLLDVIDLLAKAGIGKGSYSVVNQGMTDYVLNAGPWERRSILEDAAGVKPFQIKKKRAQQKLETSLNNLVRVEDLIKEIKPHLHYLERQAKKAERKKTVEKDLKKYQKILLSYRWERLQKEKQIYLSEKQAASSSLMNEQRELDKIADELKKYSQSKKENTLKDKLEQSKKELQQKLNQVEKNIMIGEGKIELLEERIKNEQSIKSIPLELNYIKKR